MRVVSLFAGIGGIDLGLERAGMTTVAQVENDPWCNQVLEKHWPNVPRWTDIHDVDPKELPDHDIIAGGFPCQPVSIAGTRLAQDDPRWLWPEFHRIVRVVRPRYVLVENVPGLASAGMGDILGDLAEIGYDTEWTSVPAAAVGAPHLRWRIFIVGYPAGSRLVDADTYDREHAAAGRGFDTTAAGIASETDSRPEILAYPSGEGEPPAGGVRGRDAGGRREHGRAPLFARSEVAQPADPEQDGATLADPDRLEDGGLHRGWQVETATPVSAGDGEAVADPEGEPIGTGLRQGGPPGQRRRRPRDSGGQGNLPDAEGLHAGRVDDGIRTPVGADESRDAGRGRTLLDGDQWATEPDVGRVADGVPSRVDRLRGLGNAVVPQVAELIGRLIMEDYALQSNPR